MVSSRYGRETASVTFLPVFVALALTEAECFGIIADELYSLLRTVRMSVEGADGGEIRTEGYTGLLELVNAELREVGHQLTVSKNCTFLSSLLKGNIPHLGVGCKGRQI